MRSPGLAPAWRRSGSPAEERKRAGLLSKGMQRRLALARALLCDPAILLIDEATHDLDPEGARRVRALVASAAAERSIAVLWTTQRLEEIAGFADRVTLLDAGTHPLLRLGRRSDRALARPPLRADDADDRARPRARCPACGCSGAGPGRDRDRAVRRRPLCARAARPLRARRRARGAHGGRLPDRRVPPRPLRDRRGIHRADGGGVSERLRRRERGRRAGSSSGSSRPSCGGTSSSPGATASPS